MCIDATKEEQWCCQRRVSLLPNSGAAAVREMPTMLSTTRDVATGEPGMLPTARGVATGDATDGELLTVCSVATAVARRCYRRYPTMLRAGTGETTTASFSGDVFSGDRRSSREERRCCA